MSRTLSILVSAAVVGGSATLGVATAQSPAPAPPLAALPDFSDIQLRANNWNAPMSPSQWSEAKLGGYDWRADHAVIASGALALSVSERASGQVQTHTNQFSEAAMWEVDVTLPMMREGLVAAPLWVFNNSTKDEIDFEVVGKKGLQLTLWSKVNGAHRQVWSTYAITGDLSGRRYRLGIAYFAGRSVGFYVDGELVARVTPQDSPSGFPSTPLKPLFDIWVTNGLDPAWAGRWTPLAPGERLTMTVHGYKAGPLPQGW